MTGGEGLTRGITVKVLEKTDHFNCKDCGKELGVLEIEGVKISEPCELCSDGDFQEVMKEKVEKVESFVKSEKVRQRAEWNFHVPKRFASAEYAKIKPKLEGLEWFKTNWRSATGLVLVGKVGTGKTYSSIAVVGEILSTEIVSDKPSAIYETMFGMVRKIKESWDNPEVHESEVVDKFSMVPILVIDEVGIQFRSETEKIYFNEILNNRYNNLLPTVLVSNLSVKELTGVFGERAMDRLRENGKMIVFDGKSLRGNHNG